MRALVLLALFSTLAFAQPKDAGDRIVTEPILFDPGKATIQASSRRTLDHLAVWLARSKIELVEIGVHTDARGSDTFNLELSQSRAEAVRDYLVGKGVPATKLRAKGYGETRPLDKRPSAAAAARNRRTELLILRRT